MQTQGALVFFLLSATVWASPVGSVELFKVTNDFTLDVSTECYVKHDGIVVRTVAGGQFDPDKLIVNKQYPGTQFFGFKDIEKKFESIEKQAIQTSKAASGLDVAYEAHTFDKRDNPVHLVLYKQTSKGEVQQRTDKTSKQFRAFLDAVCH